MGGKELPEGWVEVSLDRVAQWGSGGTPSRKKLEYYNGNIPWIKTGDLGEKYIKHSSEFITEDAIKNSSAKMFSKGSVALAMYGATIGKTSILDIDATTNQACAVGKPNKAISSEFLYYLLRNEKDNFIAKAKGGAQPNISQTVIKNHNIFLPSIHEQNKIVSLINRNIAQVEQIQNSLNAIPKILEKFRQSVLADAVSGKLTGKEKEVAKLDFVSLGSIIIDSKNGISKRNSDEGTETTVLRLANFKDSKRVYGIERKIKLTEKEIEKYQVRNDDILIVRVNGSVSLAGKFILYKDKGTVEAFCDHFIKIQIDSEKIIPKYLLYIANQGVGRDYLVNSLSTSAGQNTINQKSIRNLLLKIPPLSEQTEIVRRVEELFAFADQIEERVAQAQSRVNHLTQSILNQAFTGKLTEQWRADNPELITGENSATTLLASIESERKTAKTSKNKTNKKA
ncbi:restriction endonuclease subunit S [Psychrobacter sp. I-STPA10]|uniref:restriction endonuclease subunit S n=1 Tax=Psychrobacter sp. I-STPA10 TaxID=2585769 RepID=UPI001E5C1081|nr:restriction endonuclease subunit S [Psychrobacter sp. I-STPA10]